MVIKYKLMMAIEARSPQKCVLNDQLIIKSKGHECWLKQPNCSSKVLILSEIWINCRENESFSVK